MDQRLETIIDLVRDITAESLPDEHTVRDVSEELRAFLAEGYELNETLRAADGDGPGRHLLYQDPCSGFVVAALTWPVGAPPVAHDHGTWGLFGVLEGRLEVTEYAPPRPGEAPVSTRTFVLRPGDVVGSVPAENDLHSVRNVGAGPALTLHVFGRAIERSRAFDPKSGTFTWDTIEWAATTTADAIPG